ncbi:MFS transporter [Rhodoblastus sp.]|jgi:MFS family permease|uniref:MFS transporter n=1 Tax=Rhodoblastus sp. TaxID=1962975 RepID=UPI00260C8283|nr:MFS transporter [Rhodoblastus sp.]
MRESRLGRTGSLAILLLCQVAAMACWFASNASIAAIKAQHPLSPFFAALLTSSVQAGFVVGAFFSALLALPDRIDKRRLFRLSALVAALCTGAAALLPPTSPVAPALRFATGISLAGVYPVGMAMAATWARGDLGLLIGLLVGALTLGSASPHLAAAFGGLDWRAPILFASAGALIAAALAGFIGLGPNVARAPEFRWSNVMLGWRSQPLRLANFGYFGHMWELYAMWAWIGAFVAASFRARYGDAPPLPPALATFFIVASGAFGALLGGFFADRVGRTLVTSLSMAVSGLCCLLIGFTFGGSAAAVLAVGFVWGVSVIADSAQFSASTVELCEPGLRGAMLTAQTCFGFLLTLASIHLMPDAVAALGWRYAFATLAIGPFLGVWAMLALRARPEAEAMAGGRR